MEGLSHEEGLEAMAMAILHDLAEVRTGDLDFVAKNYTTTNEEKAVHDQFAEISFGKDLEKLVEKYEERTTLVAKCTKDADSLAQTFHEWVLMWQGNKLAQSWFEGDYEHRLPYLRTESAKQLMLSMKDSNPQQWWWSEFVRPFSTILQFQSSISGLKTITSCPWESS
jgi:putative hydrolase of HD superfamily